MSRITHEMLAERAKVDIRQAQRIEAGTGNRTVDYLDRFRRALRCEWSDLLRDLN